MEMVRTGRRLLMELRLSLNSSPEPKSLQVAWADPVDVPLFCSTHRPLCHCLNVEADEVRAAIDDGGLQTVRQVSQTCGAGGGCTSCHRHIKRMLAQAAAERQAETALEPVLGFA